MAAVGYYIRVFGGSWGPVLQVAFFFAALTGLALILVSGRVRAWVKVNLNKHFFPFFGKKQMYQITSSLVQDWVTQAAAEGLSAAALVSLQLRACPGARWPPFR